MDHLRIKKVEYNADKRLISHLEKFKKYHPGKRIVLLKHHTYVNFTLFDNDQPTFINVVRHPVGQFASFYYFQRYGWGLSKGDSLNDGKNVLFETVLFSGFSLRIVGYRNNIINMDILLKFFKVKEKLFMELTVNAKCPSTTASWVIIPSVPMRSEFWTNIFVEIYPTVRILETVQIIQYSLKIVTFSWDQKVVTIWVCATVWVLCDYLGTRRISHQRYRF